MPLIRSHSLFLGDAAFLLRPMVDADLPLLARWYADPEVLHFTEGDVEPYSEDDISVMYRTISRSADCFILSVDGSDIGECRLQSIPSPFDGPLHNTTDCRRIDIVIGEKDQWGKGYGSRAIGLLCRQVFENTSCTHLFAFSIPDYNERCCRAFRKNGFQVYKTVPAPSDDVPGEITMFKGKLNKIF